MTDPPAAGSENASVFVVAAFDLVAVAIAAAWWGFAGTSAAYAIAALVMIGSAGGYRRWIAPRSLGRAGDIAKGLCVLAPSPPGPT